MSVSTEQTHEDRLYKEGFDDGKGGRTKKSFEPEYLEGYYDGLQEDEETEDSGYDDDYDYYCSGCSDCDY